MSRITRRTIIPVNQITPLTYRDGVTYIQLLTELSDYIKTILHPSLQHTVDQLVADVESQMDKHHDQYVDGVQEFQRIHDRFMSDVNASLVALNDTAVSDLVEDETSLLGRMLTQKFATKDELHITDTDVVKTVGVGGDYDTINEGLHELSRLNTLYQSKGVQVELRLLKGFVMAEQVVVEKQNLGWITITSEDPIVPIQRSAITQIFTRTGRAAFTARNQATLPYISCLFEFDESGEDLGQHGCVVYFNSSVVFDFYAGILRAPARGINVQQNSLATLFRANFSYAGEGGVRVANSGRATAEGLTAIDCGQFGVSVSGCGTAMVNNSILTGNSSGIAAQGSATVSAMGADVSQCTRGIYAQTQARVEFRDGLARDCSDSGVWAREGASVGADNTDVSGSETGYLAQTGSKINAHNSIANRCDTGVHAFYLSEIMARSVELNNCDSFGVRSRITSTVDVTNATILNAGRRAIEVTGASTVNASGATGTNAGDEGVRVADGSTVNVMNANFRRGEEDHFRDVYALQGSQITGHGLTGGSNLTPNSINSNGILFQ